MEILRFLELSAFYSHRSMDGVVKGGKIASIYKTGLHRTVKDWKGHVPELSKIPCIFLLYK